MTSVRLSKALATPYLGIVRSGTFEYRIPSTNHSIDGAGIPLALQESMSECPSSNTADLNVSKKIGCVPV